MNHQQMTEPRYCHANYFARMLASGPTPYGLEFDIVARDSTTDMEMLKFGTRQDDAHHVFDPHDYPFSNTQRDLGVVTTFGDSSVVATEPWFKEASRAQQVNGCVFMLCVCACVCKRTRIRVGRDWCCIVAPLLATPV